MKQKLILAVSIIFAVIAFAITRQYIKSREDALREERAEFLKQARLVYVAAAKTDIPGNSKIEKQDLNLKGIPQASLPEQAILENEWQRIVNRKSLFEIKKGSIILWSDIQGGEPVEPGLAQTVSSGMRAISLNISGAAAVSGMVRPADRVDVLGTFNLPSKSVPGEMETVTLTILQNVTVLATGQTLAKDFALDLRKRKLTAGYSTVTLEVTSREAEHLVFAQQMRGSLTLALRNPDDQSFEASLPEVNFEQLEKKLPELNEYRQQNIIRQKRR